MSGNELNEGKVVGDLVADHDLNVAVLITVHKDNSLSMVAATRPGLVSPAASILLSRVSAAIWPNGGPAGNVANKIPC